MAEGRPTDDPTLRSYQMTTGEFVTQCSGKGLSHVEESECLSKQVQRLKILLKAAIKRRLADADESAAGNDNNGRTGAEIAKIERSDILASQKAWEAYSKAQCFAVSHAYELGGGNGGDLAGWNCFIRHYVNRLNELRG